MQADPDPYFNVGTYSQESVIEAKNGVYFHHPTGFYRYDGGEVSEISRPIIDIVNNISLANYSNIAGYLEPDGDHICWSVGNVTIGGVAYTNVVVRYTISTQVWTHYSYPTQFLVGSSYNNGTNIVAVVGDNAGKVYTINSGLTDNGTEIFYAITHPFDDVDGLHSTTKIINTMFFIQSGMNGANINYQNTKDIVGDFTKKVGQLTESDTGFSNLDLRGRNIKIRLTGISKGEPISYEGYEMVVGTSQLITFK